MLVHVGSDAESKPSQEAGHLWQLMKTVLDDLLNSMNVQLFVSLSGRHQCVCVQGFQMS